MADVLDYSTPRVPSGKQKKRLTPRRRTINAAVETLVLLMFAIGFNVMAWVACIQMARAGRFTEISGPGGHPVRTFTSKSDPVEFWFVAAWFPVMAAGFLIGVGYPALRGRRKRTRALIRLERLRLRDK